MTKLPNYLIKIGRRLHAYNDPLLLSVDIHTKTPDEFAIFKLDSTDADISYSKISYLDFRAYINTTYKECFPLEA